MRLTFLGTGSALPSPDRVQTGVLLETDDATLLVDCGSGVIHRLARIAADRPGVDHHAVDAVLLTHHHLDHVADLPTLAKARVLEGTTDLRIVGPPGTRRVCEHLFAVDDLAARLDLSVRELPDDTTPVTVESVPVRRARMVHSQPGFAYRIGDAVTISGDTEPTPAIAELADGCAVLVHECAHPDGNSAEGHTTPTELGRVLADVDVETVYLTHPFPDAERAADRIAGTVREYTDATVRVAVDLDAITIEGDHETIRTDGGVGDGR